MPSIKKGWEHTLQMKTLTREPREFHHPNALEPCGANRLATRRQPFEELSPCGRSPGRSGESWGGVVDDGGGGLGAI